MRGLSIRWRLTLWYAVAFGTLLTGFCLTLLILTRQQLLDSCWGADFIGDERTVDGHIRNLRAKLKDDLISTIRGIGYKFIDPP